MTEVHVTLVLDCPFISEMRLLKDVVMTSLAFNGHHIIAQLDGMHELWAC